MGRYLKLAEEALRGRWARRASAMLATIQDDDLRIQLREDFEERAAICEFDGGLHIEEAERIAYEQMAGEIASRAAFGFTDGDECEAA